MRRMQTRATKRELLLRQLEDRAAKDRRRTAQAAAAQAKANDQK
jgi:hypothetical protein